MRMGRRTLLVGALVAVARAYDAPPTGTCEAHCAVPCAELNGDVEHECGGCVGPLYACRPGADGYPNTKVPSQRRVDPQQVVDVGGVQQSPGVPKDHLAVGGEYVVQATAAAAARLSELERQRGELARGGLWARYEQDQHRPRGSRNDYQANSTKQTFRHRRLQ